MNVKVIKKSLCVIMAVVMVLTMPMGVTAFDRDESMPMPLSLYDSDVLPYGSGEMYDDVISTEVTVPDVPGQPPNIDYFEGSYPEREAETAVVSFSGIVFDAETEQPIANATVSLLFEEQLWTSVQTNQDGTFFISAISINEDTVYDWSLIAEIEGFEIEEFELSELDFEYQDEDLEYVPFIRSQITDIRFYLDELEVEWDGSSEISGVVTSFETGAPLAGARVQLQSLTGETFTAVTDGNGFYEIIIPVEENAYGEYILPDLGELFWGATIVVSMGGNSQIISMDYFINYLDEFARVTVNLSPSFATGFSHVMKFVSEVQSDTTGEPILDEYGDEIQIIKAVAQAFEPMAIQPMSIAAFSDSVEIRITNATELNQFLLGTLPRPGGGVAQNHDTFILANDIIALRNNGTASPALTTAAGRNPGAGTAGLVLHHSGRPATNALGGAFTGTFMGCPEFMAANGGRAPQIINLALRPRVTEESGAAATPLRPATAAQGDTGNFRLGHNDFGFIRLLGDGAVIQDITFMGAYFYDGGTGTTTGANNDPSSTIVSTTAAGTARAMVAGGHGSQITGSTNASTIGGNYSTHRGFVAGRVYPGSTVTINNVNIGEAINATNHATGGRVTTPGHSVNNISTSRHHGLWNARTGGMIGLIGDNATVNISNSDVSVRLFHQTLGVGNQAGGIAATTGTGSVLNITNVNVAVEITETNWANSSSTATMDGMNTRYAGGLVGRNNGTINVNDGSADTSNIIFATTIREATTTNFNNGGSGGAAHAGRFGNVGRLVGYSTGPVSASNLNLSGTLSGFFEIGGAVGAITAPISLTNVNASDAVGGTATENRGTNAGGIVGRILGTSTLTNVHVTGNVNGGRTTNNTISVGGLLGNMASGTLRNVSFNGNIDATGVDGNIGGIIARATGSLSIYDAHTLGGTMTAGAAAARNRSTARGGIVGMITPTGNASIHTVSNHMPVQASRGDGGGIVGRIQGNSLVIANATNHATVNMAPATAGGLIDQWRSAGGIVGNANNTNITISDTVNYGAINGSTRRRGTAGIVGNATGASRTVTLARTHNHGVITHTATAQGHIGGLLGWMHGSVVIRDSINHQSATVQRTGTVGNAVRANTSGGLVANVGRNLVIERSHNRADVTSVQNRTIRGMGGLVGYVRGNTNIANSTNRGNVWAQANTASRVTHSMANVGGIIGRSDMIRATAAQRQTTLTNVINFGDVGVGGTGTNNSNNTVGGIIGRTISRGGTSYNLTNVSNMGAVRGRNHVGGIVGFNSAAGLHLNSVANYGEVMGTMPNARGHFGGFIGRTGNNNIAINRSYNVGTVRETASTGVPNAFGRNGSMGGFIGLISSGDITIRESFNAGTVNGAGVSVGGLVGISRGRRALTIIDSYNVGTVSARGAGAIERAGNGVLGRRDTRGGAVNLLNVYNAGNVQGRPIYADPRLALNRAMGTYITFNNVFYDTTVHSGLEQPTGRRPVGVDTDIMTRGLLPGITSGAWLSGTMTERYVRVFDFEFDDDGNTIDVDYEWQWQRVHLQNTYPYLAWQTGGAVEELYFSQVRRVAFPQSAVMDLPWVSGHQTEFMISQADLSSRGWHRWFIPYGDRSHAAATNFGFLTETSTIRSQAAPGGNNLISHGIVSDNWVIGIDIEDRTGIAVIAVDAVDYALNPQIAELIPWATFRTGYPTDFTLGPVTSPPGGVLIVRGFLDQGAREVEASAWGYGVNNRIISTIDYLTNPTGTIRIPLGRQDIDHVRVEVRYIRNNDDSDEPVMHIVPDSELAQERLEGVPGAPWGPYSRPVTNPTPGNNADRHFMLADVQLRDLLHVRADNFDSLTHTISFGDFVNDDGIPARQRPGDPAGPDNPYVVVILMDDLRVGREVELRVVWYEGWNPPDTALGDEMADPRRAAINRTGTAANPNSDSGATIIATHRNAAIWQPEGLVASPASTINAGTANLWTIANALEDSIVRMGAAGFRTREASLYTLFAENDEGDRTLNANRYIAYIDLDRIMDLTVRVVERIFTGTYNADGEPNFTDHLLQNAEIEFTDGYAIEEIEDRVLIRNNDGTFRIGAICGEEIRITAGEAFEAEYVTADWMEHVIDPVVGATDAVRNAARNNATGTITVVLQLISPRLIEFVSADTNYGTVEVLVNGVETNPVEGLFDRSVHTVFGNTIQVTTTATGGSFQYWTSEQFPGERFYTTAQILNLPITYAGTTRFTAHFTPATFPLTILNVPSEDLTHLQQTITIGLGQPIAIVPGHTYHIVGGTPVTLRSGTVTEDYIFLGWYSGANEPAAGTNINDLQGAVRTEAHTFSMPNAEARYFALWGEGENIGGRAAYTITFHLYTARPDILDEFVSHSTGLVRDARDTRYIHVIEIPVSPGELRGSWLEQALLEAALGIGHIYGTSNAPGHAFWGWFTGDTMDASGRINATSNLRRPFQGNTCQLSAILTLVENATTDALITDLFGDSNDGNIDLFAVWALWGDVDDNDIVNIFDLNLLQQYIRDPQSAVLARPAAKVTLGSNISIFDLNRLQQYIRNPQSTVLGVAN